MTVRQVDQDDILNTRAMRGADCLTEHALLPSPSAQKHSITATKRPCKIDVLKLRDKNNQQKMNKEIDRALAGLQHQESEVVEENWNSFKSNYTWHCSKVQRLR